MTTAREIIQLALKDAGVLGVGQTALAEDANDALTKLNWMISEWNRKRWLVYHLRDMSFTSTGSQTYSVGPAGNFNIDPRPDRLEAAFFRQLIQSQPNQVDYPLEILPSYEDYSRITLKQLQTFPMCIFYDTGWPTGTLYPWPVPQAAIYEIHIIVKSVLTQFTNLSDEVDLPEEYRSALELNLATRLWPGYGIAPDPTVMALAKNALNTIRGANTQIARLSMPQDLVRPGLYNPYSDQFY